MKLIFRSLFGLRKQNFWFILSNSGGIEPNKDSFPWRYLPPLAALWRLSRGRVCLSLLRGKRLPTK